MTLRTAGLIAGVLGVILLAVGVVANAVKPAAEATPSAEVQTSVVVIPPEVLALSPDAELTISGDGHLAAHTARAADVEQWTSDKDFVFVTGIEDWETLSVDEVAPVAIASPSPSPSASGSASASPAAATSESASPSPSASSSPSASPSASAAPAPSPTPLGSQDVWRDSAQQEQNYTVAASAVPVGLTLVVEALDGSSISSASLAMPRTVDDDWISQVMWWGIALSIVGLIALIALFVDVRPAQSKGEEWLASRAAIGSGKEDPKPGSRRARRAAGAAMPVATIPAEATTGSIPVVIEAEEAPTEVQMVAVTGSLPTVQPGPEEPEPEVFEPPVAEEPEHDHDVHAHEDEEERP